MALNATDTGLEQQRRRARRAALGLAVVAFLIYACFIFFSVRRSHG
jgi:capsule polysaccharide export protein KpsC/LpsZ